MSTAEITLDIETIPSQEQWVKEYVIKNITPPASIKKEDSIAKWWDEKAEAAIEEKLDKCGLQGATNHIVAISLAVNDEDPIVFSDEGQTCDEKFLLQSAIAAISSHTVCSLICHNIIGFDLKIIKQRCMVLGIDASILRPYFNVKPWESALVYDTMTQWDAKNYTKLDLIARAFELEGKGAMDGSMVYQYWKDGRHEEIAEYCKADVALTRAVYKRMVGKS